MNCQLADSRPSVCHWLENIKSVLTPSPRWNTDFPEPTYFESDRFITTHLQAFPHILVHLLVPLSENTCPEAFTWLFHAGLVQLALP